MTRLQLLKELEPLIGIATLLLLAKYASDTASIKRASINQTEALFQPCLVLEYRLRGLKEQIWDLTATTTAASELPEEVFVTNIGTGPAQDIALSFDQTDSGENLWDTDIPFILAGNSFPVGFARNRFSSGEVIFEAEYKSISGTEFKTTQRISNGIIRNVELKKVPRPSYLHRLFGRTGSDKRKQRRQSLEEVLKEKFDK